MDARWSTAEGSRSHAVPGDAVSDTLALAMKLQTQGEAMVDEERMVAMGRELGIQPEYVRQALVMMRDAGAPAAAPSPPALGNAGDSLPLAAAGRTLSIVFSVLLLPLVFRLLPSYHMALVLLIALAAAFVAGWAARLPRPAALAGAFACPVVLVAAALNGGHGWSLTPEGLFAALLSLIAFGPLCSAAGTAAASLRRWEERLTLVARQRVLGR